MPPNPPTSGSARPAAVVNRDIRALVVRARGRRWTHAEQTLYGLLRDEWVEAERAEMTTAA